jgi:hypothetical protein
VKVALQTHSGKVGEVRLERGRAVGSNERVRRLLRSVKVVEPCSLELLSSGDGDAQRRLPRRRAR